MGASPTGGDVIVSANRDAGKVSGYTATYSIPSAITTQQTSYTATFYANPSETGAVVATATGKSSLDGTLLNFISVTLAKTIKSVVVYPAAIGVGSAATQLLATGFDSNNTAVAVTSGAFSWSVVDGDSYLSLTKSGMATGTAPGAAHATASVDGISSPPGAITVLGQAKIKPTNATVAVSQSQVMTATDAKGAGFPDGSTFKWTVSGSTSVGQSGTLNGSYKPITTNTSSVTYKAPTAGVTAVVAVTVSDASGIAIASGSTTVNVPSISIEMTPVSPNVLPGGTVTFAVNAVGGSLPTNASYTWQVAGEGAVVSHGATADYTAGASGPDTVSVIVDSDSKNIGSTHTTVTVLSPIGLSVTVSDSNGNDVDGTHVKTSIPTGSFYDRDFDGYKHFVCPFSTDDRLFGYDLQLGAANLSELKIASYKLPSSAIQALGPGQGRFAGSTSDNVGEIKVTKLVGLADGSVLATFSFNTSSTSSAATTKFSGTGAFVIPKS